MLADLCKMNAYVTRVYDLSNLKKIKSDDSHTNVLPLKKISASKLFHHPLIYDGEKVCRKMSSQPDLLSSSNEQNKLLNTSTRSISSCDLNHNLSESRKDERSWCDIVKTSESCVDCWNEAWQKIINDLYQGEKVDSKTLEAVYLLRNAHIHGFFRLAYEDSNESNGKSSSTETIDERGETTSLQSVSTCNGSLEGLSSECYVSEEERPSSVASSGRSTPSFRKKPKRPNIRISDHPIYRDYVEIRRTDSLTSIDSEMDRYSFVSDCSFVDIPLAYKGEERKPSRHETQELEETLREESSTPTPHLHVNVKNMCRERPDSPTSLLLLSVLNSEDPMLDLHTKLSPLLRKFKKLENESKLMSHLKEKLPDVQEASAEVQEEPIAFPVEIAALEAEPIEQIRKQSLERKNFRLPPPRIPGKPFKLQVAPEKDKDIIPYRLSLSKDNPKTSDFSVQCCPEMKDIDSQQSLTYEDFATQCCPERKHASIQKSIIHKTSDFSVQCRPEMKDIDSQQFIFYGDFATQCSPERKDAGIQKSLELITEVCHQETLTDMVHHTSVGVGVELHSNDSSTQYSVSSNEFGCQNDISLSDTDKYTETIKTLFTDKAIGDNIADLQFKSISIQECPTQVESSTQSHISSLSDAATMVGCPHIELKDFGIGDQFVVFEDQNTQTSSAKTVDHSTQSSVELCDQSSSCGCSFNDFASTSVQHSVQMNDFMCGDGEAEIITFEQSVMHVPFLADANTGTDIKMVDSSVECVSKMESKGVSDNTIFDLDCEKCATAKTDAGVGSYENSELCSVNDKLCDCTKPLTNSIGVGDYSISEVNCHKCGGYVTVVIGDEDNATLVCDDCKRKGEMQSVGVGDLDVNDTTCEKCLSKDDNIFNFDLNILNRPVTPQQQAVLCHYCGNKVDLNDSNLDVSLQAMRDSMQSVSCGMKRTTTSKHLNVDFDNGEGSTRLSDTGATDDDDDDEDISSGRNDVIEACQMLHHHFSGEKPLKQPAMMKYVGIIQALWFKTVKRRRANASVVKSYIDLFQQRIPELLETIINLSDDEGNTALHYALTYKNLGVVSILLDSGECDVDHSNQAGYSPIMLAALVGFEKKNDKYIIQRLFRLGDINKESIENGQTPLMLAVSNGNMGIVELLLDAGCDINAVDDEGSTALMCACEHGNINIVKALLAHPDCDATIEDNEGSTALSIAMDARRKDLALLVYGSLNFDTRGRIKLSPSKQSLLGLGRRSPSPVIGRR